jgi:ABC-2 type transport system permease protein
MNHLLAFYSRAARIAIIELFQYPMAQYFYMIGMLTEPIVYLVVWSTVANAQGGQVNGYTPGAFAAYYIIWTLVRNMNIVLTPFAWESRIQRGRLNEELLRPRHPMHNDLAFFIGWKVVAITLWLPIAAFLIWFFQPAIAPQGYHILIFCAAIWGGFALRFMLLWGLGLITFWTTRVSGIFELYFTVELLFSGRLVPMALMPTWAQQVAAYLPFKWAFGYPIEVLLGQMSLTDALAGLGMQALWTGLGLGVVMLLWRSATRKFSAVGN